jgi:nicotinic acid mononucleotide adenylyltransferase
VGHADPRNDSDAMRELSESFGAERAKQLLENFTSLSLPQVSSTAIREALNRGELPQHLPPRVEQLIRKYRLYERGEALARSLGNRGN